MNNKFIFIQGQNVSDDEMYDIARTIQLFSDDYNICISAEPLTKVEKDLFIKEIEQHV